MEKTRTIQLCMNERVRHDYKSRKNTITYIFNRQSREQYTTRFQENQFYGEGVESEITID